MMLLNYLKIAWRNLLKNKIYSLINISGLTVGMAVAFLITLWVWNEISFDYYHENHRRIAQVMDTEVWNNTSSTSRGIDIPLANLLSSKYSGDFKKIALATPIQTGHIMAVGEKKVIRSGMWVQPDFPGMFTFKMLEGSRDALKDPSSIVITASLAKTLFGLEDPMNKAVDVDDTLKVKVAGVIEDLPHNTSFSDAQFFLSWDKYLSTQPREIVSRWGDHAHWLFIQASDHVDFKEVSAKIKNIPNEHIKTGHEQILLHPMDMWHLHDEFKDGKVSGGRIQTVWLFGMIGIFVLLLACINFVNLSTARSEKRAKEVGIRKAIGSLRAQLIGQFLSESVLVAFLSLLLSIGVVLLLLPLFNKLSGEQISFPWSNPLFWLFAMAFTLFTGFVSGCYPAFYLSGFNVIKVLKGSFRVGKIGTLPRKILVVAQFSISIILIIGTMIVYKQIQFAKNRPVGYSREGLISVPVSLAGHYQAIKDELIATGAVVDMAQSSSPQTSIRTALTGFDWRDKDPNTTPLFGVIGVSHDYGKTIGWRVKEGRDFSRDFSDTGAFILNESAVKLAGLKNPVGENFMFNGVPHKIIGVVENMLIESPYTTFSPVIFTVDYHWDGFVSIRLKPGVPVSDALARVESVFKKYNSASPFEYHFVDEEFAKKFSDEQRIGDLATGFSILAIFISCLGIFGLASFIAEQRTKEIGIRKVLGASVLRLWTIQSKEFVILVMISGAIAIPISLYFLNEWLQKFDYRTSISWWVFVSAMIGSLIITILTVSYQSIKAAMANPIKSLRTE